MESKKQKLEPAIAILQEELVEQERTVLETKKLINNLCKRAGLEELYTNIENSDSGSSLGNIGRDQFYGKALATAIREYLEMRKAARKGPATVNEIYQALVRGGYKFNAKNKVNAKRSLYISLGKNTTTFHRLPTSSGVADDEVVFGLLSWYPEVRSVKSQSNNNPTTDSSSGKNSVLNNDNEDTVDDKPEVDINDQKGACDP